MTVDTNCLRHLPIEQELRPVVCEQRQADRFKENYSIEKAYVWSALLYGCETWTIITRNMTKLQSFEMWAYRKLMKISCTKK